MYKDLEEIYTLIETLRNHNEFEKYGNIYTEMERAHAIRDAYEAALKKLDSAIDIVIKDWEENKREEK